MVNTERVFCKMYKYILPYLEFEDIHPLLLSSKKLNTVVDSPATWYHIVEKYDIYWTWDRFDEQDTGGTSIRCALSDLYDNVRPCVKKDENGNVILIDPKSLVKANVEDEDQSIENGYAIVSGSGKSIRKLGHWYSESSEDDESWCTDE